MNCLFCDITKDKNKRLTIYEDDLVVVIMDKFPFCDGHLLVIPKKHYESIDDVDTQTLIYMFEIAKKYGGGGHKGASGFSTEKLIFENN